MEKEMNTIVGNRHAEAGISLVETLIGIVLFLMVTGTIFGLMSVARVDRDRTSRRSDTLKNARAAMHLIGRDALNAGLSYHAEGGFAPDDFLMKRLGVPQDNNNERDRMTSMIPANNVFANTMQAAKTDGVSFIYRDMDATNAETVSIKSFGPAGLGSATPRMTTEAGQAATISVHDLFLVQTDTTQVAAMVTAVGNNTVDFAPSDPLELNQSLTATIGPGSSQLRKCVGTGDTNCSTSITLMKKFFWIGYRVNNDGTLIRTTFGNNTGATAPADQVREQPLAYGIQDMQIRYVLENGTVTDDPTVGPNGIRGDSDDTPGNMNLVRQITITLKVQSTELDEVTDTPDVITVTSTFAARNIVSDAG